MTAGTGGRALVTSAPDNSRFVCSSKAGTTVLQWPPEELLLILCAHGFKHFWGGLKWICDVAELIRARPEMDWERTRAQATRLGGRRALFLGLLLARQLLGAPIPEDLLRSVEADRTVRALAAQVRRQLFSEARPRVGFRNNLRIRERWRDRGRYCLQLAYWALVPGPSDQAILPLPAYLSFLHYPFRPFRVATRLVRKLAGTR